MLNWHFFGSDFFGNDIVNHSISFFKNDQATLNQLIFTVKSVNFHWFVSEKYFSLLNQLIFTDWISEIWLIHSNLFLAIWISRISLIISRFWLTPNLIIFYNNAYSVKKCGSLIIINEIVNKVFELINIIIIIGSRFLICTLHENIIRLSKLVQKLIKATFEWFTKNLFAQTNL